MSTTAPVTDPYAAYGGAASTAADPYAAYGGSQVQQSAPAPKSLWQTMKDNFNSNTQGAQPGDGMLAGALHNFTAGGGDVVRSIAHTVMHPLDTIDAAQRESYREGQKPIYQQLSDTGNQVKNMVMNPSRTLGQLGTGAILGEAAAPVMDAARPAIGKVATAIGDASQDAGTGLMNKTVGTLKADFKRGANPARGYLSTGNGASLTMQSVADKAAVSLDDVGTKLSAAYQNATASGAKIPVDLVAQEMAKPIQKAIDLETGPGGTGNTAQITNYMQQFAPAFDKAAQNGGFTPSELFDMKRSIAQNTNWSDPTQFNLKSVRQQQTGALSGILSDSIPETSGLNQQYQDLSKMVNRASERANTGSRPLTAHIYKAGATAIGALAGGLDGNALGGAAVGTLIDSVPVKTAIASGLYNAGDALSSFGRKLAPADSAPVVGVTPDDLGNNSTNGKDSNPQGGPPRLGSGNSNPTTGPAAWANVGAEKLAAHVASDSSAGITKADIADLIQTASGQRILINASDLTPGSAAMKSLIRQIKSSR